jgi:hypothetical protein
MANRPESGHELVSMLAMSSGMMIDHWSFSPTTNDAMAMGTPPEFTITLVGGQQQLHCTGHDPRLLLGEWPAEEDWNPEAAQGITDAVNAHKPEHPNAWGDATEH